MRKQKSLKNARKKLRANQSHQLQAAKALEAALVHGSQGFVIEELLQGGRLHAEEPKAGSCDKTV